MWLGRGREVGERVCVLGNVGPSLTVIRSLARAGYEVLVGREDSMPLIDRSRYASEFLTYPSPEKGEKEFAAALDRFLRGRPDVSLVFPVGERTLSGIAHHRSELPGRVEFVMPDPTTLTLCLDKSAMSYVALELGIPAPQCRRAVDMRELRSAAEAIGYPCVVKPVDSLRPFFERKAIVCRSEVDLETAFSSWPADNDVLLVQEYAAGWRQNCQFAAIDGEVFAYFEHRTLRTDRPDGMGHEVEGVSTSPTEPLRKYTEVLAKRLKYSGVGCVQFVADDACGTRAFMEINPRLDGTCAIAYHCGYDFPRLAIHCVRGGRDPDPPIPASYPTGKRVHWFLGDVLGLSSSYRRGDIGRAGALAWSSALARAAVRADIHLTWAWDDPLPTFALHARALRAFGRRIGRTWLPPRRGGAPTTSPPLGGGGP
jgi:predicted ATP-grasp superfamily ATP-dependent carboligase